MHRFIYVLLLLLPATIFCQQANSEVRTKSYETFVYKISSAMVEKFTKDSINLKLFEGQPPFKVFEEGKDDKNALPTGNYVFVTVNDNEIRAKVYSISSLYVYTVNNRRRIQLAIVNKEGTLIENAKVWVNHKAAPYNTQSKNYHVSQKSFEDGFVKIVIGNDTSFAYVYANEEQETPVVLQRWQNFKKSKVGRIVQWVPWQIERLFDNKRYTRVRNYKGFMVFSQPKYKQTDTVKFKAYLFNHRSKMYNRDVRVNLSYSDKNKHHSVFLKDLSPSSPGSYLYDFPLSDTLPGNTQYTIAFVNKKEEYLLHGTFQIEDYVLDDISAYELRADKDTYYPQDTMHFYASAKDANGLGILDVNTTLTLRVNSIVKFDKDSVYVPDTLYKESKPLLAEGDTKFSVPTNLFPAAALDIKAFLLFRNSNNEIQEKQVSVSFSAAGTKLLSQLVNDTITTTYLTNGAPRPATGIMVKHDQWNDTVTVQYPFKVKIDPLATGYSFYRMVDGKIVDSSSPHIPTRYDVSLERVNRGDTLALILDNPYGVPVSYTVVDGNKIVGSGKSSNIKIEWGLPAAKIRRGYQLLWQYRWLNKEVTEQENIVVLHNIFDMEVKSNSNVFPGQKDSIKISVTDFKKQPAKNINLTAFAYNNQFSKDIHVPDPPNLVRYRLRHHIERDSYEEDNGYVTGNTYHLGNSSAWRKIFNLDTMLYYRTLFPKNGLVDMSRRISDYPPQVTIHCVKDGEWQRIHLLYINNQLVYYSDVSTPMKNVYEVRPGFTKFGIRLKDKLIEIDSLYLQPSYKHDLYIDIDRLPAHSKVTEQPAHHTEYERTLLESRLLRIEGPVNREKSFLWQGTRLVEMEQSGGHLVGPFQERDSLHYFQPNQFDIHFFFEPGYEYRLSKKIARLEKRPIFNADQKEIKFNNYAAVWSIGDTLPEIPLISYEQKPVALEPRLNITPPQDRKISEGSLSFTLHRDSSIKYVVLYPINDPDNKIVFDGSRRTIEYIAPGKYGLLLVQANWKTLDINPITIVANQTLCLHTEHLPFKGGNSLLYRWWLENEKPKTEDEPAPKSEHPITPPEFAPIKPGTGLIGGNVFDKEGELPIPGVSIVIKGTGIGTLTDVNGHFEIRNIAAGVYTLVFSWVGYETKEVQVTVLEYGMEKVVVGLSAQSYNLQEVVVIGYGVQRQHKALSFSVANVPNDLAFALSGRVAGVAKGVHLKLRGAPTVSSFSGIERLYIIDGVLYDEMPQNISKEMISSMVMLDGAAASAIYGARAAQGAVVITTKNSVFTRKLFRDYAFWQPEIFTNARGEASFEVQYPENITGWQLYVLGMDKKKRIGKTVKMITAYKPVWAELNMPRFLIESDSAEIVGKSVNYTEDGYSLQSQFTIDGKTAHTQSFDLRPKEAVVNKHGIVATASDTLTASFNITSNTGFKDGEEHKIPVLQKGVLETDGRFWILNNDTTVSFSASHNNESVQLYAFNNTLDVLLNEIEDLKKYPHGCNEQNTSKLRGLLMEKEIRKALQQKFSDQKLLESLETKILKAQQYDGGWGWWENNKSNIHITNYIVHALLPHRSDPRIGVAIRNGLLYLQNQLQYADRSTLLASLFTMSRAKHAIDYKLLLQTVPFDSLNIHGQWQWISICQNANLPYVDELAKVMRKANREMLGAIHWGTENYEWYNNNIATTVLAFEVLSNHSGSENILTGIVQFFLNRRSNGYWRNTVESASIISAILPFILQNNKNFVQKALLAITGDTSFNISNFPAQLSIKNPSVKNLNVRKTGGGLTYFTLFQNHWNSNPQEVADNFKVSTTFFQNGKTISNLTSGAKVTMVVEVKAMKSAEYVMMEVPVPAGCVYGKDDNSGWVHKELRKDKAIMFFQNLDSGTHHFEIELESRFNGSFTLNPAKVSLMYFPTFYGRNEMKKINISAN